MARRLRPPPDRTADQWADEKLELPPGSAEVGQFRTSRTPFLIPIVQAIADPRYRRVVWATGSQMSKTQGAVLNVIGHRFDENPTPVMYVGPTKSFVEKKFEPRLSRMIREVPSLFEKLAKGKREKKTAKEIGGITLDLAWAGSAAEVAGAPVGLAFVDERDRMTGDTGGEGDPTELVETRGATFPRFKLVVTSSVTEGRVEVERHPGTGLEHWQVAALEDIQSPTWKLWQEGTRFEWAWPCVFCGEYFIPRSRLLWWPEGATPTQAFRLARLRCPTCSELIDTSKKVVMNARGRYAAPGQKILPDGTVLGDPPESSTASFWTSALCSPWRTFNAAAERWLKAEQSGDPKRVQVVVNTEFGELHAVAGEAPKWEAVAERREEYESGVVPEGVVHITTGVDVAKNRFDYTVRGWGSRMTSWLIKQGEIDVDTDTDEAYSLLAELLHRQWGEQKLFTRMMLIDSGYRPGDKYARPEHRIYAFCRLFPGWARPAKGRDELDQPVKLSHVDYTIGNQRISKAVELVHVNTNHMKSWIHGRLAMPRRKETLGAWHIGKDADDAYCKQIVSESRLTLPSGKAKWIRKGPNHKFDAEVLALAGAWLLGLHAMQDAQPPMPDELAAAAEDEPRLQARSRWLGRP